MPNEKIVSHRDKEQLLTSETYRLYNELKEEILKDYPPPKQRTREQSLEVSKRISDLMWEPNGAFQQFLWEQMSDQEKMNQDRRAESRKTGPKPRYEEDI
jgi:hypothetical protein